MAEKDINCLLFIHGLKEKSSVNNKIKLAISGAIDRYNCTIIGLKDDRLHIDVAKEYGVNYLTVDDVQAVYKKYGRRNMYFLKHFLVAQDNITGENADIVEKLSNVYDVHVFYTKRIKPYDVIEQSGIKYIAMDNAKRYRLIKIYELDKYLSNDLKEYFYIGDDQLCEFRYVSTLDEYLKNKEND